MADREHAGNVLLPAPLHDGMLRPRRRERRLRAESRRACCLDIGIGGRFVVVHDDQQVVVGLQSGGNAAEAHVAGAEIAGEVDDVDLLVFDLALAHQRPQARGHAHGRRAAGAELGVHPGHDPGRGHVGRVGHIHAACGPVTTVRGPAALRKSRIVVAPTRSPGRSGGPRCRTPRAAFLNPFDSFVIDGRYSRHD